METGCPRPSRAVGRRKRRSRVCQQTRRRGTDDDSRTCCRLDPDPDGQPGTRARPVALAATAPALAPAPAKKPALIPEKIGDAWGFIDAAGKVVVAPKYEAIFEFKDGFWRVTMENFQGLFKSLNVGTGLRMLINGGIYAFLSYHLI